jgi:hypothetical protein
MDRALLLVDIEVAKEAISLAENELQAVVGDITVAPLAAKGEVSEVVRAASLKLRAAKAKLADLQAKLIDLEESVALAKLEAARAAIDEAEKYLDRVLSDIVVVAGADTTMVTDVVQDALTKLRIAKTTLADLESITTDKD